ncbi:WecB/TagA/CpsF family glycosyltransferase [Arthrobacter gengyunqii]|uniref:WecB/TagA/CpsF family glycosyltransferase n=1 Tax=Arthrobacter gengyunqii TaxID=2886940 RepID=A0ABS8GK86_9MICC|nr:WecB/TagA/CpsF family glycosyltransferase [Arthrobacter gengyunqii]MCC3266573.1 WecB/TagA/CpsF family glycosyltransferase [Arthrobacter gengyunqii]
MSTTNISMGVGNDQIYLAGMPLFSGDENELKNALQSMINSDRQHLIVTANVDQAIDLADSASLYKAYERASLRLVDGMPLIVLARLLGVKNLPRHTGADLLPTAAAWSMKYGWRVAIVGGAAEIGAKAAILLCEKYPGSNISHIDFPVVSDVTAEACGAVAYSLRELDPDIVFICLGSPKQEKWMDHWSEHLPSAVFVGAGAAVDFAAGAKSRAPKSVQVLGLEWVWRLAQEPRRLAGRYLLKGPKFLLIVRNSLSGARK